MICIKPPMQGVVNVSCSEWCMYKPAVSLQCMCVFMSMYGGFPLHEALNVPVSGYFCVPAVSFKLLEHDLLHL